MKILEIRLMNMANNFLKVIREIRDAFWSPDNIEEATELTCDSLGDVKTVEELNKTLKSVNEQASRIGEKNKKPKSKTATKEFSDAIKEKIANPTFIKSKDLDPLEDIEHYL